MASRQWAMPCGQGRVLHVIVVSPVSSGCPWQAGGQLAVIHCRHRGRFILPRPRPLLLHLRTANFYIRRRKAEIPYTEAVSSYSILVTSLRECPQQIVSVGLVEFGERHDTRTNGQQTTGRPIRYARGKLNGEGARHARHADILARMSDLSARMSRGCYHDATRKLFPWNLCLT